MIERFDAFKMYTSPFNFLF